MKPPENFTKIIGQKRYSTRNAILITGDDFWDGRNWERHGRNTFLYRSSNGAYFTITLTQWEGERDHLQPISQEDAVQLYETTLTAHRMDYQAAFPGVEIEDA